MFYRIEQSVLKLLNKWKTPFQKCWNLLQNTV